MQLPTQLLKTLEGIKGFEKEAFEKIHATGEQITSIRLNPSKPVSQFPNFPIPLFKIPWTEYGYYLKSRPSFTFDPLFHAGCYYVQEASSMFLEQALKQSTDLSRPLRILDLSAAPGGKSTHIQSLISENSLLVSNEVIRSRANILKDNIIKWGSWNVVVTNNDPADLGKLENYFDVIVVDAPCSGSGLFRREPAAMEEWSLQQVQLCTQRQQRILADVWPALKEKGILIYSTCSYSIEEDEEILDWMAKGFQISDCRLQIDPVWNITEVRSGSGIHGYRFWPDKVMGEGFFIACLRKTEGAEEGYFKTRKTPEGLNKNEKKIVEKWVKTDNLEFIRHLQTIYAWPEQLHADFNLLLDKLKVIYSGTLIGELVRDKLVPDHALSMCGLVNESVPRVALNYDEAIEYLKKKDPGIQEAPPGWQLVTYESHPLGWINVLSNRINNYYPKELRILKDTKGSHKDTKDTEN